MKCELLRELANGRGELQPVVHVVGPAGGSGDAELRDGRDERDTEYEQSALRDRTQPFEPVDYGRHRHTVASRHSGSAASIGCHQREGR